MDVVQKLLSLWELPNLVDVFKEQEVSMIALKCLTESDICELIPKVGPRSIFRARLQQWRRQNYTEPFSLANTTTETKKVLFEPPTHSSKELRKQIEEPIIVKLETLSTEENRVEDFLDTHEITDDELLEELQNSPRSPLTEDNLYDTQMTNSLKRKLLTPSKDTSIESMELEEVEDIGELKRRFNHNSNDVEKELNVLEILTGNCDGRKAISFYKINNTLDLQQRRKIVNVIISAAIEIKTNMYVEDFDNIVKQIIELFPKEKYDTYFVPRNGTGSPKGALYNKYLNLSRQLRKDGLLAYRNQRRIASNGTSSIETGRNE